MGTMVATKYRIIVKEMKDKYGKHITEIAEEIVTKL